MTISVDLCVYSHFIAVYSQYTYTTITLQYKHQLYWYIVELYDNTECTDQLQRARLHQASAIELLMG